MRAVIDLSTSSLTDVELLGRSQGDDVQEVVLLNLPTSSERSALHEFFPNATFIQSYQLLTPEVCADIDERALLEARDAAQFVRCVAKGKLSFLCGKGTAVYPTQGWARMIRASSARERLSSGLRRISRRGAFPRAGEWRLERHAISNGGEPMGQLLGSPDRVRPFIAHSLEAGRTGGGPHFVPMHVYREGMRAAVLQDGHIPTNYPGGLYRLLLQDATVVPRNGRAERYFAELGLKTAPVSWFGEPLMSTKTYSLPRYPRVLFALNHVGYWSSEIDNADTDRMVSASIAFATSNPTLPVRLRLHPTAAILLHDGLRARERWLQWIREEAPTNLEVSACSLAEDLEWASVVLSEYSDVLITGWALGKPGASVRLGYRRHYMEEFTTLGYPEVALEDLPIMSLNSIAEETASAATRYNEELMAWKSRLKA